MKILVIFPSTIRGGVEEYTLRITSAAVREGWEVHAAFPRTDGTASLVQDFTARGMHYHPLEIAEASYPRLTTTAVRKYLPHFARTVFLLRQIKPDVVQIALPYPDFCLGSILACGFLQVPTVVRFGLVPSKWLFGAKQLKAYAWARARNQQWVAVSENNRKLICESFQIPYDEVRCIYNGTKLMSAPIVTNQEESNSLRHQLRQELGVPATSKLALTVGRLDPQKGYDNLVPAIPHIIKEFPDVRFVWVGEGKQRDSLVSKLREYGVEDKVLFLGYRSDVPRLLASADLFIFPTHYEGHPSALLEAMAYGLPVIASDASSIPEIIEDMKHGLLCRTDDSCSLLEAIRWALRHPEKMQEMAQKTKLRVQDFSEAKMIQETLDLWQKLSQTPRI